jgi:hypothetical protein
MDPLFKYIQDRVADIQDITNLLPTIDQQSEHTAPSLSSQTIQDQDRWFLKVGRNCKKQKITSNIGDLMQCMYWGMRIGLKEDGQVQCRADRLLNISRVLGYVGDTKENKNTLTIDHRIGLTAIRLVKLFGWGILLCPNITPHFLRKTSGRSMYEMISFLLRNPNLVERIKGRIQLQMANADVLDIVKRCTVDVFGNTIDATREVERMMHTLDSLNVPLNDNNYPSE